MKGESRSRPHRVTEAVTSNTEVTEMVKGLWGHPEIQLEITLLHYFQSGGWAASNAPRFGDPRLSGMVAEEGGP